MKGIHGLTQTMLHGSMKKIGGRRRGSRAEGLSRKHGNLGGGDYGLGVRLLMLRSKVWSCCLWSRKDRYVWRLRWLKGLD